MGSISFSIPSATPIRFKPLPNHLNITLYKSRIGIHSNYGPELKSKLEKNSSSLLGSKRSISIGGSCAVVVCNAKDSSGSPEEHKALETVLKLYDALKNKNDCMISDVISEECFCVSNFVSAFQSFHGKKQVLAFFLSVMKTLGNNIEFVVQPTVEDGMIVGVSWKLEWDKVPLPLGKGFSFYTCHIYQGKIMIKNVEIFMEPLIHLEPFRLRIINSVMNAMEKLNSQVLSRRRAVNILFIVLIFWAAMAFFLF
ncbi:uncharacterized protein LOC142542673 [Primulina tabacum]|uniref:uncharacterized protein LOC142542673 n=1 Tax=Primulina tabacum TaxID=48773 RepID=UPI003F598767